jgi:hypothetical protein
MSNVCKGTEDPVQNMEGISSCIAFLPYFPTNDIQTFKASIYLIRRLRKQNIFYSECTTFVGLMQFSEETAIISRSYIIGLACVSVCVCETNMHISVKLKLHS